MNIYKLNEYHDLLGDSPPKVRFEYDHPLGDGPPKDATMRGKIKVTFGGHPSGDQKYIFLIIMH